MTGVGGSSIRCLLLVLVIGRASPGLAKAQTPAARSNIPLKNWGGFSVFRDAVYDDLERPVTAGLADRAILDTTPLSRVEAARLVARAVKKIRADERAHDKRQDLKPVLYRLIEEFRGNIDKAEAQLRQAEVQTRQTLLQATTDVEKAHTAYTLNRQTLQVYTAETLAKAEESYQIAEKAYREGASTLLDVLDARRTLNQTRVAANQARSDYTLSLYQLEQVVGRR